MFDSVLNTPLNKICEKGLKLEKSARFVKNRVLAKSKKKSKKYNSKQENK